ncbi:MAG: hypothetical protein L7U72_15865, partial [Rubripirellula sp.]|nr:hypothetical protein [Rubripirellula sp.]
MIRSGDRITHRSQRYCLIFSNTTPPANKSQETQKFLKQASAAQLVDVLFDPDSSIHPLEKDTRNQTLAASNVNLSPSKANEIPSGNSAST